MLERRSPSPARVRVACDTTSDVGTLDVPCARATSHQLLGTLGRQVAWAGRVEDSEAEVAELVGRRSGWGRWSAGRRRTASSGTRSPRGCSPRRRGSRRSGRCRPRSRRAAARRSGTRRAGSRSGVCASSGSMPSSEKIRCCMSGRWIRTLPEPSSQPFSTRSYDCERTDSGSDSSRSMSSGCGVVNGWCAGIGRPSSSSPSNSGKSTTHRNSQPPSETGGRPRSSRSWPSTSRAIARSPATISTRSPATAPERVDDAELLGLGQELHDRRLERAAVAHAHPHETRRAERLGPVGQRVELRAADVALALDADALDRLRARERLELGRLEHVGELDELHPEPRVGLVGAVALHRLEPRHPRDRRRAPRPGAPPRPRRAPRPTPRRARLPGRRSVISTSSCMNSNWRSARRSSSRRQRAIWK